MSEALDRVARMRLTLVDPRAFDDHRIDVVKVIRETTRVRLADAKRIMEHLIAGPAEVHIDEVDERAFRETLLAYGVEAARVYFWATMECYVPPDQLQPPNPNLRDFRDLPRWAREAIEGEP